MSSTEGFAELARDFQAMGDVVGGKVRPIVTRGAGNIQRDWRAAAARSRHFRMVPMIGFDIDEGNASVEAEIGPAKIGAGNLANIAHFGGRNGGGGRLPDPQEFLDNEEPRLMAYLEGMVGDIL